MSKVYLCDTAMEIKDVCKTDSVWQTLHDRNKVLWTDESRWRTNSTEIMKRWSEQRVGLNNQRRNRLRKYPVMSLDYPHRRWSLYVRHRSDQTEAAGWAECQNKHTNHVVLWEQSKRPQRRRRAAVSPPLISSTKTAFLPSLPSPWQHIASGHYS